MDKVNKERLEAVAEGIIGFFRFITSWYVCPFWIIGLSILFAVPWWLCIVLVLFFGTFSWKMWQDD